MMNPRKLPDALDAVAPDGSEIRFLAAGERASSVYCALPPGIVSLAAKHREVEEIWFCLEGCGEVWRKLGDDETGDGVHTRRLADNSARRARQFRNTGEGPLRFDIATMSPWLGEDEAVRVDDYWSVE